MLLALQFYAVLISNYTKQFRTSKNNAAVKGGEIRDTKTLNLLRNIVSLQVFVDVSRFSPCLINLTRNKNICCGLKKVVAKSRATLSNKFWLCCSFFIKLTTCRATNLLVPEPINQ